MSPMYTAESGHAVLVGMTLTLPSQLDEVFPDPCPLQILPVPQGLESTFNKERFRLPGSDHTLFLATLERETLATLARRREWQPMPRSVPFFGVPAPRKGLF